MSVIWDRPRPLKSVIWGRPRRIFVTLRGLDPRNCLELEIPSRFNPGAFTGDEIRINLALKLIS